jgi:hypothetical protein
MRSVRVPLLVAAIAIITALPGLAAGTSSRFSSATGFSFPFAQRMTVMATTYVVAITVMR